MIGFDGSPFWRNMLELRLVPNENRETSYDVGFWLSAGSTRGSKRCKTASRWRRMEMRDQSATNICAVYVILPGTSREVQRIAMFREVR